MRHSQRIEAFPDGIVDIYREKNRKVGERVVSLRFEEQSVGVRRFYQAQVSVAGSQIDRLIKVPHTGLVDRLDIAVIQSMGDRRQYRINRIQHKPERDVDILELQSVQVSIKEAVSG